MTHQELIIKALLNYKGDDSIRAKRFFANYTDEQLDSLYGASGDTPRQMLAGYNKFDQAIENAINWVKSK